MENIEILKGKICPYCLNKSQYGDSSIFYGKSYGMMYYCLNCDARVGVHQGTNKALGRLANEELRRAKNKAHHYFDNLWQRKAKKCPVNYSANKWRRKCRKDGYKWLAKQLNISFKYCHIGMFDVDMCNKVVEICQPYYRN